MPFSENYNVILENDKTILKNAKTILENDNGILSFFHNFGYSRCFFLTTFTTVFKDNCKTTGK